MSRVARAIGAAARALEYRDRELREKNERIQAQNQELQAQNEEIQSQAQVLQAQAEEIQSQAEELQAQNTELIQQGGELRARGEALNESNERKNHFLGVLAHELRNPLAPISNSIYVLKRVSAGSEQALRAHAVIERQTKHMIRLVDDLLDITRISQGKIRVQHEEADLAAIVRAGLEDQHGALEQGGYVLEVDLPPGGAPVRGDRTRLAQVFGNLLSNAMKFTESGGRISVSVRADPETGSTVLRVADTGIGMDAALVPLLFKPFSQGADGFKLTNAGLGLGLALVKALVDLHGGTVSAHSDGANQGSEFVVHLPRAPATP
jgi:signal transduction histidine kinase